MGKRKAYEEAGVNTEAAAAFAEEIQHHLRRTYGPRVVDAPKGFAGLFRLDHDVRLFARNYRDPVLASCANGVGTKLKIAFLMNKHDTVGIDLVAMNVNDLVVRGAEPLFFLDYLGTSALKPETLCEVVAGIATGCVEAECALLSGETAQMPGFYADGEYDLSGFAVGVTERDHILGQGPADVGDRLIGLASSGLHANGYSLVRKVFFEQAGMSVNDYVEELGGTLGRELLRPARIYVRSVLNVLRYYKVKQVVHAVAHIAGGGLMGNIPRVLGEGRVARIRKGSWPIPPVFPLIQKTGHVDEDEMYQVFNMGIGMVLVVSEYYAGAVMKRFRRSGIEPYPIGDVVAGKTGVVFK